MMKHIFFSLIASILLFNYFIQGCFAVNQDFVEESLIKSESDFASAYVAIMDAEARAIVM